MRDRSIKIVIRGDGIIERDQGKVEEMKEMDFCAGESSKCLPEQPPLTTVRTHPLEPTLLDS